MRCDLCPLCPIAQDDVCFEAEGKYGIEHADGMLGCKHPWNWIKKRDEKHTKYLGNMGTDMVVEDMFSEKELADLTELCKDLIDTNHITGMGKRFTSRIGTTSAMEQTETGCLIS